MALAKRNPVTPPLSDRVQALIEEYEDLEARAEAVIGQHIDSVAVPGVPREIARQVQIDTRSQGYSHLLALKVLRDQLS